MRVLFTTAPLAGHLLPLVPVAWALRAAGHDVLLTTRQNAVPMALRSGLPAVSCGPAAEFTDLVDGEPPPDGATPPDTVGMPHDRGGQRYAHGRVLARMAGGSLAGIGRLARAWRPDLIVSERAESAGPLTAAALGIPWVRYHWSVSELREYRDAADVELAPELDRLGIPGPPEPALVLDPWPAGLRAAHAVGHHGVRHVAANGDAPLPDWLFEPRDRPRICVTLGTLLPRYGATGAPGRITALIDELTLLDADLVVAVDDDVVVGWPSLPSSVRHAGRLPLADVLPACDAVVTHGGQGTALTAVAACLPQVVVPHLDDQFDNAEALSAAGAAVLIPPSDATPAAVSAGCAELLGNPAYAKATDRLADDMALMPAPADAVALLERLGGGTR
ncbi:nucleotide disphospho-sugar-binding domain-containing protein [Streptomyces djakartensis]|uniref:Glycosyl transferase n=1 Tax=Streptomyces djakartensis TaxID=68193 RepID=A0ABQ3A8U6_9ACTN|nr:nucleotide disphospho-sugar-binding domain-containing protein [Streptomyces djakartensis]GGY40519.1 glycosyl transferase [Streptomyces djakartensis]